MQKREKCNKQIISKIGNASDITITNIYAKIQEICKEEKKRGKKKEQRFEKIKYITTNLTMVSDDDLPSINEILDSAEKHNAMCNVLLDVINELLQHLDIDKIDDIVDFKNISRDILVTDECNQIVLGMLEKIIEAGFKKNTNGFQSYKNLKYAHMNIIKGLCTQIGYKLCAIKKCKTVNRKRTYTTYYFIANA